MISQLTVEIAGSAGDGNLVCECCNPKAEEVVEERVAGAAVAKCDE